MKSTNGLMEVKGVKAPEFNEPKGLEFEKVMGEINVKVRKQVKRKNDSTHQIQLINSKLNKIKADILMAEDEFEEMELRKQKKDLLEQLENTDDYSSLDVKEYGRKLIDNPAVQELKEEAAAEYMKIHLTAKAYEEELDKQYKKAKAAIESFTAPGHSESTYRKASSFFSSYKNA